MWLPAQALLIQHAMVMAIGMVAGWFLLTTTATAALTEATQWSSMKCPWQMASKPFHRFIERKSGSTVGGQRQAPMSPSGFVTKGVQRMAKHWSSVMWEDRGFSSKSIAVEEGLKPNWWWNFRHNRKSRWHWGFCRQRFGWCLAFHSQWLCPWLCPTRFRVPPR